MANDNTVLIRDSIEDTGKVPTHGSWCDSPDIITHSEVSDPQTFFKNNYKTDVCEKINTASLSNLIYTRAWNMSGGEKQRRISVYQSCYSLFLNTDRWNESRLQTIDGRGYAGITFTGDKQVAVGSAPLLLNGQDPKHCLIAVVSDEGDPVIPPPFSDYGKFVAWVHQNQGVSMRNMYLVDNKQVSGCEYLMDYSNPEPTDVFTMLIVTSENLPDNTEYGISIDLLGFKETRNTSQCKSFAVSPLIPAGFSGFIKGFAYKNTSTAWPKNASVMVEPLVPQDPTQPGYFYGISLKNVASVRSLHSGLSTIEDTVGVRRLIRVGSCVTKFV